MLCLTVQTGNMKYNLNVIEEKDISCNFSKTVSKLEMSPLFENVSVFVFDKSCSLL